MIDGRILRFGADAGLLLGIIFGIISGCLLASANGSEIPKRNKMIMENSAITEKLGKPTVYRQVLLNTEREAAMQPEVIVKADDGGFFIAGYIRATKQGWAAKTDAEGKLLWNYYLDLQNEDKAAFNSQFVHPAFNGAIAMSDGSVYLCGYMPHPSGSDAPNTLLTHLDAKGHLLSEKSFTPDKRTKQGIKGGFGKCTRWGEGMVIVGGTSGPIIRPTKAGELPRAEGWLWVLMLDAGGNVKWERQIPGDSDFAGGGGGRNLLVTPDSNLVISLTDVSNTKTKLISISPNGEVRAQKNLAGKFIFVLPVVSDGTLQVFGWGPGNDDPKSIAITLDERLEEVRRVQGYPKGDFSPHVAYRMPDQSFVLFGRGIHSSGQRLRAGVVHVDSALQLAHDLEPVGKSGPLVDYGTIDATAPTRNAGEFVMATPAVTHGLDSNHPERPGVLSDFKRGVVMDFINLK